MLLDPLPMHATLSFSIYHLLEGARFRLYLIWIRHLYLDLDHATFYLTNWPVQGPYSLRSRLTDTSLKSGSAVRSTHATFISWLYHLDRQLMLVIQMDRPPYLSQFTIPHIKVSCPSTMEKSLNRQAYTESINNVMGLNGVRICNLKCNTVMCGLYNWVVLKADCVL